MAWLEALGKIGTTVWDSIVKGTSTGLGWDPNKVIGAIIVLLFLWWILRN